MRYYLQSFARFCEYTNKDAMSPEIEPLTIVGIMIPLQLLLMLVLVVALLLDRTQSSTDEKAQWLIIIIFGMCLTLAALSFTDEFHQIWSPILNDVHLPTWSRETVTKLVFIVNYLVVVLLIIYTGGAQRSPFTPVLFLLPTLAIFLRQPPKFIVFYGLVSAVYYLFATIDRPFQHEYRVRGSIGDRDSKNAQRFVAIACLALTLSIGYITRPQTI